MYRSEEGGAALRDLVVMLSAVRSVVWCYGVACRVGDM